MLRERLPTPSPPLLSVPNRRSSYLRCALERIRVPWSTGSGVAKVASRARIRPHALRAFADPLASPAQSAQSSLQLSQMRPRTPSDAFRGRYRMSEQIGVILILPDLRQPEPAAYGWQHGASR